MNVSPNNSIFEQLSGAASTANGPERNRLAQEQFLELMTTQLRNQDPLKPLESGEFLGQIAQFSMVSGINNLEQLFTDLKGILTADRSVRAAELIGRNVLAPASAVQLGEQGMVRGALEVSGNGDNVVLEILDANGARIQQLQLGNLGPGQHNFYWTGQGADGVRQPPGTYQFRAFSGRGAESKPAAVLVSTEVVGVAFAPDGRDVRLDLASGQTIALNQVRRID